MMIRSAISADGMGMGTLWKSITALEVPTESFPKRTA